MKQARQSLFNGLATVSLVLCILAASLWRISYFRLDDISHTGRWHVHNFSSVHGRVFIQWGWSSRDELKRATGRYARGGFVWDTAPSVATLAVEQMSRGWRLAGFDCFSSPNARGPQVAGERVMIIPWWFLTIATGVMPTGWLLRAVRQAGRAKLGHCESCGYDLRATPDRCPECGNLVEKV